MEKISNYNTESILRERVGELEVELMHSGYEKDRLEDENNKLRQKIDLLEELQDSNRRIIAIQKLLLGKSDISDESYDFLSRQQRIFDNKVKHGFNTTNIYQEARYILEETAELMRAIEKNDRENMLEELADIVIFSYGCAEVARLGSLDTKIFEKMSINEKREYKQTEEGDFVKTTEHNN